MVLYLGILLIFFLIKVTPALYHFNKMVDQTFGVSNITFAKMSLRLRDKERSTVVSGSVERNSVPCVPKKWSF